MKIFIICYFAVNIYNTLLVRHYSRKICDYIYDQGYATSIMHLLPVDLPKILMYPILLLTPMSIYFTVRFLKKYSNDVKNDKSLKHMFFDLSKYGYIFKMNDEQTKLYKENKLSKSELYDKYFVQNNINDMDSVCEFVDTDIEEFCNSTIEREFNYKFVKFSTKSKSSIIDINYDLKNLDYKEIKDIMENVKLTYINGSTSKKYLFIGSHRYNVNDPLINQLLNDLNFNGLNLTDLSEENYMQNLFLLKLIMSFIDNSYRDLDLKPVIVKSQEIISRKRK